MGGDGWQTVAPSSLAEGIFVGAPFTAQDPRPEVRAFVTAYTRKYGSTPDGNAALAYDATKLLVDAMTRAKSTDPKVYIPELKKASYKGVTGTIQFEPNGELKNAAMTLYSYKGGKKAPVN